LDRGKLGLAFQSPKGSRTDERLPFGFSRTPVERIGKMKLELVEWFFLMLGFGFIILVFPWLVGLVSKYNQWVLRKFK
jgi:hypothetical protein